MKTEMVVCGNLVDNIHGSFTDGGIQFASPALSLRMDELDLVHGVLQMLQGLSSSLFYWDDTRQCFHYKSGIFLTHLSQTSLYRILDQFSYAATCLHLVDIVVNKFDISKSSTPPTLRAFSCSVSTWLTRMRDVALKEEIKVNSPIVSTAVSILGLSSSLSSLCSGAEYLLQIVHGAIPPSYFKLDGYVPAADIAVHILNYLYMKLNEVCLVDGGEEDAFQMLFYLLVGSLLPYIESLDSWLFQGTLDDPFEEIFFTANKKIAIEEAEFWEKICQPRSALPEKPRFINLAEEYLPSDKDKKDMIDRSSISFSNMDIKKQENKKDFQVCPFFLKDVAKAIISAGKSLQLIRHALTRSTVSGGDEFGIGELTLSEIFCVSLTALIGDGDHIAEDLWRDGKHLIKSIEEPQILKEISGSIGVKMQSKKAWLELLDDTITQKRNMGLISRKGSHSMKRWEITSDELGTLSRNYCPENPAITVCHGILRENIDFYSSLNVSQVFDLPALNDECLRKAIFHDNGVVFTSGYQFGELERVKYLEDAKMLEVLLPFPTLLPSFQEKLQISEILPFQKNCTLPSRTLSWIQNVKPKSTPLPSTILQECLIAYIKMQANYIGRTLLSKLLGDWRLLDELGVLRAIYLLGSGRYSGV